MLHSSMRPGWRSGCAPTPAVSQGTVDNKEAGKLIIPALGAFAGSDTLVVATTGGYGSGMLVSTTECRSLPRGSARENDINARFDHLGLGLETEQPTAARIRAGADRVLDSQEIEVNVARLARELAEYHPAEIIHRCLTEDFAAAG